MDDLLEIFKFKAVLENEFTDHLIEIGSKELELQVNSG